MNYQPYGYQGAYGGDADPAEDYEDEEEYEIKKQGQLSCWGNQQSMNLNPLVLTNITGSPYFKVQLFNLKVSATICPIQDLGCILLDWANVYLFTQYTYT